MQKPLPSPDFFNDFDIEGHRGCRGLLPENSIPAFVKALELGVDTLEMDVVITADKQVLVSHDPFLSHEFCKAPDGRDIKKEEESNFNLYKMRYEEIKKCECGLRPHPRFPLQEKIAVFKPLLKDVVTVIENLIQARGYKNVQYNIEIKSTPEGDHIFHPAIEEFSDLLMNVLNEKGIAQKTIVQSFDVRVLKYLNIKYAGQRLSYLIENKLAAEENIKLLGFIPSIYSPEYLLVNEALIKLARKLKMKIIPWTINDLETILKLKNAGVDGIITDYPDLILKEKNNFL
jgi:glycerophosphoryl diester phosphodiesterase